MTFEDLDLTDSEAVNEYLSHPVVQALHQDLARALPHESAAVQREHLQSALRSFEDDYRRASEALAIEESTEVRALLERIRDLASRSIEQLREKMRDLPLS